MNTGSMDQKHRWRGFAVLAAAYLMSTVDLTIVNVALPTIGRDLHFSEANLQWVVTAYALALGGLLLLGGRAADLLGRRRVLMFGVAVFTVASLGAALATSDSFLIAMRGIQGAGAAAILPAALSIVMNMFQEGSERNKALGLWGAFGAAGGTIGLLSGGLLTRFAGWEYIFYLNLPIGAAVLVLVPRLVPESRLDGVRRRFDAFGAVTVTGGLLLAVYALSKAPETGWASGSTLVTLAAAAALLIAFVVIETRVEAPLMPLRIFRSRTLAGANAVSLLFLASFSGFIFIGTLYMQQVLGYSALQTGVAWAVASVTAVVMSGVSQTLATRFSAGPVITIGMALVAGGVLWAGQAPVHGQFWIDLAGPFFVVGAGAAFGFVPISIAGLAGVAEHDAGLASGLLNTSQQVGGAVGVAIASTVAATHLKTLTGQGKAPDVALAGAFHWAFWVCGAIALIAVPVGAVLARRPATSPAPVVEPAVPVLETAAAA